MAKRNSQKQESEVKQAIGFPEPRDFIPSLIRAHNNLLNAFEKTCGIHMARWRLLYNLGRQGTASQNELSRSTTIGPAAVTRILADLERKGLISRNPSKEDNRQIIVALTTSGEQLVHETAVKREGFIRLALAGFSDAEVVLLERMLGDLERNLAAAR